METKRGIIEKITNGGWGLVRSDEGVVFLNYVLPGEEINYRIRERSRGILWGDAVDILTPSEHRTAPPCPYYGQCGGCIFQHIHYPYQKEIKKGILADDLKRIGQFHLEDIAAHYFDSPPYHCRIRARMKAQEGEGGKTGFIRKGTNTIIPIDHCLLFPELVNRFLEKWNSLADPPFFYQMDILMNRDTEKVYIHLSHPPNEEKTALSAFPGIAFSWKGNEDAAVSTLTIKDWTYHISPTTFFQVNPFQWENMLDTVESYLESCGTIIDLYSGVGFFIPLLKKFARRVIGVESHGYSVTLASRAFPGVELLKIPAEKFHFKDADTVVVDPPRSGLSKHVMKGILDLKYKKVIYISCASAAFSRDLKTLRENGYGVKALNIFDLFPQTAHFETVTLFERQRALS
jgi:23S rRNA (uracil1939-C5)-methyltransferase